MHANAVCVWAHHAYIWLCMCAFIQDIIYIASCPREEIVIPDKEWWPIVYMITVDQSHHFHTSLSWSNGEVRESVEHVLFLQVPLTSVHNVMHWKLRLFVKERILHCNNIELIIPQCQCQAYKYTRIYWAVMILKIIVCMGLYSSARIIELHYGSTHFKAHLIFIAFPALVYMHDLIQTCNSTTELV